MKERTGLTCVLFAKVFAMESSAALSFFYKLLRNDRIKK